MDQRLELHALLLTLCDHVYFQPPNNLVMEYPCIVYRRDSSVTAFADNAPYRFKKRYQLISIDQNPDGPIPDKIAALPMSTHIRFYTADDLNHDVFNVFF